MFPQRRQILPNSLGPGARAALRCDKTKTKQNRTKQYRPFLLTCPLPFVPSLSWQMTVEFPTVAYYCTKTRKRRLACVFFFVLLFLSVSLSVSEIQSSQHYELYTASPPLLLPICPYAALPGCPSAAAAAAASDLSSSFSPCFFLYVYFVLLFLALSLSRSLALSAD